MNRKIKTLAVSNASSTRCFIAGLMLVFFVLAGMGQTLDISSGIQTYVSLTNVTINLSGKCELHLTATNNMMTTITAMDAMPGCLINLNSPDAWLFLDGTRPYRVKLNQIRINGALAANGDNVRLVEYGMGSVIIPQSPSYQPLQVYSGNQFAGSSAQASLYTFYSSNSIYGNGSALLNGAINSFVLKRGYAAAFAQNSDGTGISRVYVAADGDIKVGALPAGLSGAVQFVRSYPWIWKTKKGWAGGDGGDALLMDALWNYDWSANSQSQSACEYSPQQWGAGYEASKINGKQGSTLVLGYNEPDSASQANVTVAQATNDWPLLQQSGLRLGSPAPTDGGISGWLYPFVSQADAMGLRIDTVEQHFYRCGYTGASLSNFCWSLHQNTGRRVGLTEFNNGANWACTAPDIWQDAAVIQDFLNALDAAPFVEGYNLYEWVTTNRQMVVNGVITPAGTNYLNKWSSISYMQELSGNPKWYLPINGGVGATNATYNFSGDGLDGSGNGNNALLAGSQTFVGSGTNQALQLDGVHDYAVLPPNVGNSANFTFAAWVYWGGGAGEQRIFELSYDVAQYLYLTPSSSGNTLRFGITTSGGSSEQRLEAGALTPGVWTHVAVTINGSTAKLFVNGAVVASSSTMTVNPGMIPLIYNFLGRDEYLTIPFFKGGLGNVAIDGYALTDAQIASLASSTQPPAMTQSPPSNPTGLSATAVSVGQINLSWTASSGANSYNVKRATTSGGPYTTVAQGVTTVAYSDTRANAGTTYYYVVSAVNMNGESGNSTQASATTPAGVPGAPSASTSIPDSIQAQVIMTWTVPLGGVASYNVKRSTTSGGPYTTIASPTTTSYTDTNVVNNTTYYYVVSGVNGYGEGPNSAEVNGTPTVPISLNKPATASSFQSGNDPSHGNDGSLTTRWTASAGTYPQWWRVDLGTSQPIAKAVINWYSSASRSYQYLIEISGDDVNYTTLVNNTNNLSFGDTTDIFSVSARYIRITVTGCPQGGFAAFFECSLYAPTATPPAPPAAPTGLTATAASSSQINLSWTASSGASSYNVKRATVSGGPYTTVATGVTATSYSDTGLAASTTYYYVVSAVNGGGESANSTEASTTTPAGIPPTPTGLSATAGSNQVALSWNASSGATSYNVKRATVNGGPYTTIASPATTSYTDTTAVNGTTYYYVVSAVNTSGESANSTQASATPQPPPPSAPTGLTATAGNAQVALSWTASSGATSYNVKRATVNGGPYTAIASPTGTSYTDTTAVNGTTYYYVVSAVNAGGESANSAQASATPAGPPPAPTGLTPTAGNNQVALSWTASTGATSYNVKRATVNGGPYTTIATGVATTSYTDTTAVNGTTYYYVVSAVNAAGEGANSSQVSATPQPPAPAAPTGLTATAVSASQINLSWTASSGATSYNVKRATVNGGPYTTIATGVTATSYSDTSAASGTTYYYVVSGVNGGGEGANSTQASATTIPAAPTGLAGTPGNNQVALSWNSATGATSYNVKRATVSGGPYTTLASGVTTASYTDTTAVNGTTYYYVVSAVNGSGESANSSEVSATPSAPSTPNAPTSLTASPSHKKVTLTWTQSTSPNITTNNIYRATVNGGPYTLVAAIAATTTYANTGLTTGTTYYYVVTAVNGGGLESPYSSQASATAK